MSAPAPENIRNVAFIAHGGAGKATLIEALLFHTHAIPGRGSADKGNLTMMVEAEEIARKVSITPHVAHFTWNTATTYLMDAPGYFNFLENSRGVLPGVDSAVVLLSSIEGVKPETERLWGMLDEFHIPAIGFVNQMDDEQSDFTKAVASVHESLGIAGQALTLPIGQGAAFSGVIDLLHRVAFTTKDGQTTQVDIPTAMQAEVDKARTELIEKIAESNDDLIEKYLEGAELSQAELERGLKDGILKRAFIPVLCGSGLESIGLEALLDSIGQYLPSPLERDKNRPAVGFNPSDLSKEIPRTCSATEPFSAVSLKTTVDPFSGKLSIVRVFSGQVVSNQQIYNSSRQLKQKVGHTYLLQGKELVTVEALSAGQIGAISKLDETRTGDTLCDPDKAVIFPAVKFAAPPVSYAVDADGKTDEKVASGLNRLADEDPTIRISRDEQTREMILSGMGQTHIEVILERLSRKFGGKAKLRTPRVPYHETIRKTIKAQGKLKKQTGGHGQFANCWLEVGPLPRDSGFQFIDQIVGGIIPKQYIPAIEKGIVDATNKGTLGGFPVVDIKVAVYDGSYHEVDSSDYAFQVAGSLGFKAACEQAAPVLLEPIMTLSITLPEECTGDVLKDLSSRRGRVISLNSKGSRQVIDAEAPMAEMLEYGNTLSAITSGRGAYTMTVASYREVPSQIQEKVLEARKKETETKEE